MIAAPTTKSASPTAIRGWVSLNGIGDMPRTEVYTLKHEDLLAVQDAMVRRIVEALKDFDNLYYEICNEPYFGGVAEDWQAHIAKTIADTEAGFEHKHLIAQNIANQQTVGSLDDPDNAPYTPLTVQQGSLKGSDGQGFGVKADFAPKNPAFVPAYDPDSPFANEEGVIGVPNVDLAEEAVNLTIAKAGYKAGAAVIRTSSDMDDALLSIFDKRV